MALAQSIYQGWEGCLPELNQSLEQGTAWRPALVERAARFGLDVHTDLLLDEARGSWLWLVDTPTHDTALDIQAGIGSLSAALAYHFRQVHCLESRAELRRFTRLRFEQDHQTNIEVVDGTPARLDFPAQSIDCITVHDLGSALSSPAGAVRLPALLAELRRVLRPGGCLYLGLDFSMRGASGPGGALGAALRSGVDGRRIETNLQRAGFREIHRYYAEPNHWQPQAMIPAEGAALQFYEGYRHTNFRRLRRGAAALGLHGFTYSSRILLVSG